MRFNGLKSRVYIIALTFLLCTYTISTLHAQERPSVIKGKVIDKMDQPLAGVSVIVRNTKTNFTAKA